MTLTNLINLIGLKSTDPKIATWFETYNLGKPPKTINSNQDTKGATDKVVLEYPAPCNGTLVWLLPEGSMVTDSEVIALIKPI
jgi:hypothetical protein